MTESFDILSHEGVVYYGGCLRRGISFHAEFMEDRFYYNLNDLGAEDSPDLLIEEFCVPYGLILSMNPVEIPTEFDGTFHAVRFDVYLDGLKNRRTSRSVCLIGADEEGRANLEEFMSKLSRYQEAYEKEATASGATVYSLFEDKKKFFSRFIGGKEPIPFDTFVHEAIGHYVDANSGEENLALCVVREQHYCFLEWKTMSHLLIPGWAPNIDDLSRFEAQVSSWRKVAYALGFADLAEYRRFVEEDKKYEDRHEEFEHLEDHRLDGIDPLSPVILVVFRYSLRDSAIIFNGGGPKAARVEFAKMCKEKLSYEKYVAQCGLTEEQIDPLRLGRNVFEE